MPSGHQKKKKWLKKEIKHSFLLENALNKLLQHAILPNGVLQHLNIKKKNKIK
jgi:hypothetical protein